MTLTVRERADTIGTLRHISVFCMETLARWVPTTPDLEAKVVFGRHIWDFAQHADGLGRRTHELRAALHYSPAPAATYQQALDMLRASTATVDRVACMYDAFLPDLEGRYRNYLAETDRFLDEPSVRVVERIVAELPRLMSDAADLRRERPDLAVRSAAAATLSRALAESPSYVQFRAPAGSVAETLA